MDTVVTLVRVRDIDDGANGQVSCSLDTPLFRLESTVVSRSDKNSYKLLTAAILDREQRASEEVRVTLHFLIKHISKVSMEFNNYFIRLFSENILIY